MKLEIQNLGPITSGSLRFGDLTVFVGPQASGKSIVLQLLKLLIDTGTVQAELRRYGLDWNGQAPELLDAYFGEGMRGIWKAESTKVRWNGADFDIQAVARRIRREKPEELFLIPAQRVLAMRDGWPRPFSDYSSGDPFAVRDFSERLRRLVENEFTGERLFPQERRLKAAFRKLLLKNVFSDYELRIDRVRSQKRLVLTSTHGGEALPHMVWSAGQREFIPLLLGLYWLMPPTKVSRRGHLHWVVIEELEMGLHPQAVNTVLLMILELLSRGYRVCLSTHSPQILEMTWALRNLKEAGATADALLRVFGVAADETLRRVSSNALNKDVAVHYFHSQSGIVHDISGLDPSAERPFEAGWGGLTDFSDRANTEVATAVALKDR